MCRCNTGFILSPVTRSCIAGKSCSCCLIQMSYCSLFRDICQLLQPVCLLCIIKLWKTFASCCSAIKSSIKTVDLISDDPCRNINCGRGTCNRRSGTTSTVCDCQRGFRFDGRTCVAEGEFVFFLTCLL